MKIIENTKIQTIEFIEKIFVCEECEFKCEDIDEIENHIGKNHSFLKRKNDFYWFENENKAKSFLKYKNPYEIKIVDWIQPGWYLKKEYELPCPRRCCTDSYVKLIYINNVIAEKLELIKELAQEIKELKKIKNELL